MARRFTLGWRYGIVNIGFVFLLLVSGCIREAAAQERVPAPYESKLAAGVAALKSGDLDSAEKIFTEALRNGVRHPLIFHNLGAIFQQRGDHARAVAEFREAIRLQPNYGPSHLLLGDSLLALRRNSEAVSELRRAANLMPEQPQAHLLLARAYEASGNELESVVELQKLVELAPRSPEYAYQLGKAWMKLSESCFEEIARIDPKSARLQQALGREYAAQEKYDLALAAYQRAVRADPQLPEVHLAIALILLEQKHLDEALEQIRLELNVVPESAAALQAKARIEAAKSAGSPQAP